MVGAGCTRILIRENNNLSKIYMICACFPYGISMGLIHQAADWLETHGGKRREARDQQAPKCPVVGRGSGLPQLDSRQGPKKH